MAHKVRTRTTPAERQAQAAALHASITEQVTALRDTEQWERFLTLARSFHSYSLNNVLLIAAQRPTATAVAGFKQWQAKGRQVRTGEKALKIFGYATKKITEEDPATGQELERTTTYYPVLSVFDIAQPDPIDGTED
ncbi:ArdC family protein, partial [Georgenia sp. 10Sc9-8]|nr:ArdC family protein [Georgenia halotolerans]